MWKTREIKKGSNSNYVGLEMICQNSEPELGKWAMYAPENTTCENWVEVGANATAVLCYECANRSIKNLKNA